MKANAIRHVAVPLLAALIWGTAFVFQSLCARSLPPFTVNALRSFLAVGVLLPVSGLRTGALRRRGEALPIDWRGLLRGSLVCGSFLFLGTALQQMGIATTTAGKAGFITAFYVVLVPVFGVFLKKRVGARVWVCVALVAVGLWLLCIQAGESLTMEPGDGLLIGCAVAYACQVLSVDRFAQKLDSIRLSIGQFLVVGLLSGVLSLLLERPTASGLHEALWPLLYIGVMSSGVAYTLQVVAQRGGNPTLVGLLLGMESVFSVLAGALILGDRLSGREYAGCAVMLAAVVLAQLPVEKMRRQNPCNGGE
ncbi:MAG: DMT family transporter [Oscillospiraceae bacterium]|nr:DMT family transporter [Oscillospiraceae bacterium]